MLNQPLLYPLKLFFHLFWKKSIYFCQKPEAQNLTNSANHYEQRIITVKDNQVRFQEHLHPVTNVWACCPRVVEHWRSLEMKRNLDTTGMQPEEVAKSKTELLIRSPQHLWKHPRCKHLAPNVPSDILIVCTGHWTLVQQKGPFSTWEILREYDTTRSSYQMQRFASLPPVQGMYAKSFVYMEE